MDTGQREYAQGIQGQILHGLDIRPKRLRTIQPRR